MIYSIILNNIFFLTNYPHFIILLRLIIKLRIPPFHFWLPIISKYLSWNNLLLILTLQKIIPFYTLSLFKINPLLISTALILCAVIPPYIILNINNFKILISYSSINQSGWILLLIYLKNIIWFKYFLFYSFINLTLFTFFYLFKNNFNFTYNLNNFNLSLITIFFIFNLAGLPPFSFFYIKWYLIFSIIFNSNHIFIIIIIIIRSLFILYIYTNIIIINFYIFNFKSKLYLSPPLTLTIKYNLLFINRLIFSLIILII